MTNTVNSQRLLSGSATHRSSGMIWKRIVVLVALLVVLPLFASAQTDDTPASEGRVFGGYNVQQSIEFGGRITSGFGGNSSMYNTLVNLQSGPRLLDQSLSMRSATDSGMLFDSLTESAMGFGGDPNQIARFRMSKNKLYDFSAQYRHDQYYSDYNLLGSSLAVANPNPLGVNIFNQSPHFMDTRRSLADFNLKLLPQSWMSFRLGYAYGKDEGPAYTSVHSPGDVLYLQNFGTRSDRYRIGVDVKPFARTQFSYDFFYEHDRNDTAGLSDVNALYHLGSATGILIDPGFTFEPNAKIPSCTFSAGNVANATCSGFIAYNRNQPVKTDLPTHQFAFVSNYFRMVDLSGSVTYTGGSAKNAAYNEFWTRFSNPTYSQNGIQGRSSNAQVAGNADFKATVHLNKAWSFEEKFRWLNWRTLGNGLYTNTLTTNLTAATILAPAALPAATTNSLIYGYFAEDSTYNTVQLNWSPSHKFSAWTGYKIGVREITDNNLTNTLTLATNVTVAGTPSNDVENETEHHALLGFTARPVDGWRITVSGDLMSADGAYTAITPRHAQTVKATSSYDIAQWGTVAGSMAVNDRRNDGGALFPAAFLAHGEQYQAHNRSYDLSFNFHPVRKVNVDLGWAYEDIRERSPQCIPLTPGSANYNFGATNGVNNMCRYTTGAVRNNVYPLFSLYQESTHTGYAMLVLKPVHRVTVNVGYDITSNSGYQNWLRADNGSVFYMPVDALGNAIVTSGAGAQVQAGSVAGLYPWLPQGSLAYNWHRPAAGVSIDLAKGLLFKGGYNNYDYNEKGLQILPVSARDFHGNVVTLSLKHSF